MTATPPSACGRLSPGSAAPPASSSAGCSPRDRAGAGCCSSTFPSARSRFLGAFALLKRERMRAGRLANFDALGAFLVTGGMLLLVYTLVKAPDVGWGAARTIAGLAGSAVILAAFVVNELRVAQPARPAVDPAASRESPPPTPRSWWRWPASCRCSSSSRSTCRPCSLLADPDRRCLPAADGRLHHRGEHLAHSCSRASAPSRSSSSGP